jgi:hypothetical protein
MKNEETILKMVQTMGDIADLFDRMSADIISKRTKSKRGRKYVLNAGDENRIRYLSAVLTQSEISKLFDITQQRVSAIVNSKEAR